MKNSNNKIIRCCPKIDSNILSRFKALIDANLNCIDFKEREVINNSLAFLENIQTNVCLYNNKTITTYNKNHKLWGIEHNLILDANGSFDSIYESPKYISVELESRPVDHCDSTLYWYEYNTSASNIKKNKAEYLKEMVELINQHSESDDKILLVIQKEFEADLEKALKLKGLLSVGTGNDYNEEMIAINHFGNLIGENDYREFSQCWILGTPNIPLQAHLVRWMQYNQSVLEDNYFELKRGKSKYILKDKELEKLRMSQIIGDLYQAIKRIQRNPKPKAKIFIVNGDSEVVTNVADLLNGIQRVQLKNDLSKVKASNLAITNSNVLALIEFFEKNKPGVFSKGDISKETNTNKSHLSRYLKHHDILAMEQAGLIKISTRSIIIN
jgi:hypothetical protein